MAKSLRSFAAEPLGGTGRTLDAAGNLMSGSGVKYQYDPENRLVKVSQGTQYVARFAYDGDVRRVKRVDNYGTIHYIGDYYESNRRVEGQEWAQVVTKHYWAQLGPYRRLLAVRQGGAQQGLYYVHTDHLGGAHILSDGISGAEVGALRYQAYGQTRVQTGSVPTDKKFTGQTLDLSTGLYFYGARYYDSALGRFVQPDSIVPQPGNPQSLNRYSYTLNNPLKYTDPTGHREIYDDEDNGLGLPPPPPPPPRGPTIEARPGPSIGPRIDWPAPGPLGTRVNAHDPAGRSVLFGEGQESAFEASGGAELAEQFVQVADTTASILEGAAPASAVAARRIVGRVPRELSVAVGAASAVSRYMPVAAGILEGALDVPSILGGEMTIQQGTSRAIVVAGTSSVTGYATVAAAGGLATAVAVFGAPVWVPVAAIVVVGGGLFAGGVYAQNWAFSQFPDTFGRR